MDSDEELDAVRPLKDQEVSGLEKFLERLRPKLARILDHNASSRIFDNYDVIWEDGALDETDVRYKIMTDFDFFEANDAT